MFGKATFKIGEQKVVIPCYLKIFHNLYFFICQVIKLVNQLINLALVFFDFGLLLWIFKIVFRLSKGEDLRDKVFYFLNKGLILRSYLGDGHPFYILV